MTPSEQAWRSVLKRLQQAIESKDPNTARHRENEAVAWKNYRAEMRERAAELELQERAEQ